MIAVVLERCAGLDCAPGYGDGVREVGSGGPGSAVGDPEVRHDDRGIAGVEGLAATARLSANSPGKHRRVLGAGVQRTGAGMGRVSETRALGRAASTERAGTATFWKVWLKPACR